MEVGVQNPCTLSGSCLLVLCEEVVTCRQYFVGCLDIMSLFCGSITVVSYVEVFTALRALCYLISLALQLFSCQQLGMGKLGEQVVVDQEASLTCTF